MSIEAGSWGGGSGGGVAPGAGDWSQGGNSFSALGVLGTNDAFGLTIRASGATRVTLGAAGNVLVASAAGQPVAITAGSGTTRTTTAGNIADSAPAGQISRVAGTSIDDLADGNISVTSTAGNIGLTATGGAVQVTANSSVGVTAELDNVDIQALVGAVTAYAQNAVSIRAATGSFDLEATTGLMTLQADSGVAVTSAAGNITLNSATADLELSASTGTVSSTSGVFTVSTTALGGVVLSCASGANADISLTPSLTGGVLLPPRGAGAGNTNELRFRELAASGVRYSGFKAPDTYSAGASFMYTLPPQLGPAGAQLTDVAGDGVLSWDTPARGPWSMDNSPTATGTTYYLAAGNRAGALSSIPAGVLQISSGSVSSFRVNLVGNAANVAGQQITFLLVLNGVNVTGATITLATTAGAKTGSVSFAPVAVPEGSQLTVSFTLSAALSAACTNVCSNAK